MAEWSKAADLSSVIFGCVGSNPIGSTDIIVSILSILSIPGFHPGDPGSIPGRGMKSE